MVLIGSTARNKYADVAEWFRNRSILITGGLGFIGSHLARRMVEVGADVTIIDSLIPQYGGNKANIADFEDKLTVNISDVRDPHSMKCLVQGKHVLFNLAGQTSHIDSMEDPFTDLAINAQSQLHILEACRHCNPGIRIVFASTRQVYGRPLRLPVDEDHPVRPVDINGINKAAGEEYHLLYDEVYDIHVSALRLTNTYGPGMRIKDARQTFIGIWIRQLLKSEPFEVWGGRQLRDFNYVDDCVDALMLAAQRQEARRQVFNLGSSEVVSLIELAELLIAVNEGGEYVLKDFPAERKRIDIGDYYSDFGKLESVLGWSPDVDLRTGLRHTLDYFRVHKDRYL